MSGHDGLRYAGVRPRSREGGAGGGGDGGADPGVQVPQTGPRSGDLDDADAVRATCERLRQLPERSDRAVGNAVPGTQRAEVGTVRRPEDPLERRRPLRAALRPFAVLEQAEDPARRRR